MPKHNPERDQGIYQQHFPASLCHIGAHGFACLLSGGEGMSLNFHPLPNLPGLKSHLGEQARTHTQRAHSIYCWGNQVKEGVASSCDCVPALLTV